MRLGTMTTRKRLAIGALAILVAGAVFAVAVPLVRGRLEMERGRQLAATHCSTCHLQPSPDILPRRSWEATLGYMGFWLGITHTDQLAQHPAFARDNVASKIGVLARDNVLPQAPVLDDDRWAELRSYYVDCAPAESLPQVGKPELHWELPRFRTVPPHYAVAQAVTTLVHIRESAGEVYVGDGLSSTLTVLDGRGRIKTGPTRFTDPLFPVAIWFARDTAFIGSIGDLMSVWPSSEKLARIAAVSLDDLAMETAEPRIVIDDLYRMADMKAVDLNRDGKLDFVVCGFGAAKGSLSVHVARDDGGYREIVLLDVPGAVAAETHDFNGDGLPDILALMADAREGLHLFLNRGDTTFEDRVIFEKHPGFGHTFLDLQDFDGDGQMDVLVVNGDNVDSDPYNTSKNYHGLRIYLNRGDLRFEEAWFYPMYGATIAKAADFDNDGDLDIAATAYYPDFAAGRREAFAYLENQGDLVFEAFTNTDVMNGRWLTMDVGDLDGDGDVDVVLGGAYLSVGMFAHMDLFDQLSKSGPSVLLLENTLH